MLILISKHMSFEKQREKRKYMKYMLASNIERARERINDAVDSWLIPS
jgi:hypothetical protein